MLRGIAKLVAGLLVAVAVIGAAFLLGMRAKSPVVLNAVRRTGRATKGFVLPSAGTPGSSISIVRHTGRRTGRTYETPVQPVPTDDGFVLALPYGPNTDWVKNVLAAGSATIVHDGDTYEVVRPEMVPMSDAEALFSPKDQRTHRLFRVEHALLLRRAEPSDDDLANRGPVGRL
jgi:deazaflavin-dependent oxidoreductase (nitroreductase family)